MPASRHARIVSIWGACAFCSLFICFSQAGSNDSTPLNRAVHPDSRASVRFSLCRKKSLVTNAPQLRNCPLCQSSLNRFIPDKKKVPLLAEKLLAEKEQNSCF